MATKKSAKAGKRSLKKSKKLVHTKSLAINAYMKLDGPTGGS
jgi:hypothetical protein